jgi:hypothetical protein
VKRKRRESSIKWFSMGQWPVYVGFTSRQALLDREVSRLCPGQDAKCVIAPTGGGAIHSFERPGKQTCHIVTINDDPSREQHQVAAMICHEAVHLAQRLWDDLGEKMPGAEAEAYLVQYVTQCCLYALDKERAAAKRKKRRRG